MKRVLKAEHLSKCYRSLQAVDDVSLRLESEEVVGLLSPGEAEKTAIHCQKAEHLSKRYRSLQAVDDVSLHLESGEAVGLPGSNGAGKTAIHCQNLRP